MEQLTIFDLISSDEPFEGKTIEQIAADISMLVGISFNPHVCDYRNIRTVEFIAKLGKKATMTIDEGFYNTEDERDGRRFIGVSWSFGTSGGGCPCDSIDEAVGYLRRRKAEYESKYRKS